MRTISSMKKGLPADASTTWRLTCSVRWRPPNRLSTRTSLSVRESEDNVMVMELWRPAPHAGRTSSRSGEPHEAGDPLQDAIRVLLVPEPLGDRRPGLPGLGVGGDAAGLPDDLP